MHIKHGLARARPRLARNVCIQIMWAVQDAGRGCQACDAPQVPRKHCIAVQCRRCSMAAGRARDPRRPEARVDAQARSTCSVAHRLESPGSVGIFCCHNRGKKCFTWQRALPFCQLTPGYSCFCELKLRAPTEPALWHTPAYRHEKSSHCVSYRQYAPAHWSALCTVRESAGRNLPPANELPAAQEAGVRRGAGAPLKCNVLSCTVAL